MHPFTCYMVSGIQAAVIREFSAMFLLGGSWFYMLSVIKYHVCVSHSESLPAPLRFRYFIVTLSHLLSQKINTGQHTKHNIALKNN